MTEQFIIDLGFSYREVKDSRGLTYILLKSLTEENVEHEFIVLDEKNGTKGVMDTCYHFSYTSKNKLEAVVKILYKIQEFHIKELLDYINSVKI